MEKQIFKVENPVYLTKDEMNEKYRGKQVLITNIQDMPDHSEMHGGIVRYYANGSMKELWQLLARLRETEGVDTIACCSIVYLGPIHSTLPIKGGVL